VLEDRDHDVEPLLNRITNQLASEVRRKNEQASLLSKIVKRAFEGLSNIRS
jgi:hypothetical protein